MKVKNKRGKKHFQKIIKFLVLKALEKHNLTDYELDLIKNVDTKNCSVADHNMLHLFAYNTLDGQLIDSKTLTKEISKFEQKRSDIINNKQKQFNLLTI